jgi:hypothetical protein
MWKMAVRSTVYRHRQSRLTVEGDGWDEEVVQRDYDAYKERVRIGQKERKDRSRNGEQEVGNNDDDSAGDENSDGDEDSADDDHEGFDDRDEKYIVVPEPDPYKPRQRTSMDKDASTFDGTFSGDSLQIIVKLANIHLTLEKPEYDGGSWHIEVRNLTCNPAILSTAC